MRQKIEPIVSRGVRNKNPFNIKRSQNSWKGKIAHFKSTDDTFEQFTSLDFGLRAGFLLLRNYLHKGYDTPKKIIERYAPPSENITSAYLRFVVEDSPLDIDTKIGVDSLTFYWLCQRILRFESSYELTYNHYRDIVEQFRLW